MGHALRAVLAHVPIPAPGPEFDAQQDVAWVKGCVGGGPPQGVPGGSGAYSGSGEQPMGHSGNPYQGCGQLAPGVPAAPEDCRKCCKKAGEELQGICDEVAKRMLEFPPLWRYLWAWWSNCTKMQVGGTAACGMLCGGDPGAGLAGGDGLGGL